MAASFFLSAGKRFVHSLYSRTGLPKNRTRGKSAGYAGHDHRYYHYAIFSAGQRYCPDHRRYNPGSYGRCLFCPKSQNDVPAANDCRIQRIGRTVCRIYFPGRNSGRFRSQNRSVFRPDYRCGSFLRLYDSLCQAPGTYAGQSDCLSAPAIA